MNIIITCHTYWPHKDGVQYVNQYLAEGLVKKGHNVVVITSHSNNKETLRYDHNGVHIIDTYLETHYSFFVFGRKKYKRLILKECSNCDCMVNSCVQSPNNNIILPLMKKLGCKKVLFMHGMHNFTRPAITGNSIKFILWHAFMNVRWSIFYKYNRKQFLSYDTMIDIHETSKAISFMKKLGYDKPINILHNAVENFDDIILTSEDYAEYPILSQKYILCVANFIPNKNQQLLIKAFSQIENKDGYHLVLIGRGMENSKYLEKFAKEVGVENTVHIYENISRELTKKMIKACSIGALTSKIEVYPISLCEYIAAKHPFVSTDVGCVKSIPGGIIANTEEEISSALKTLINDTKKRNALAEAGYSYAKKELMQERKIEQFEKLLIDVM